MRSPRLGPIGRLLFAVTLTVGSAGCGTTEPLPSSPPGTGAAESALATSVGSDPLALFEGELREATTREGALVRALADAQDSAPKLRLAVGQMRAWVDAERAWLADHPIEPCFDAAGTKFEAALDSMTASADAFEALASASVAPSDDVSAPSLGSAAGQSLQDAARALADAAGLAKVARTECR
jgi:hypothetical protein